MFDRACPQTPLAFPHRTLKPAVLVVALAGVFAATPPGLQAQTLPTGGAAVHGTATITNPAPNQLRVVTQNGAGSQHSAINWQSFSISAGSSANFVQPSTTSTSINRVVTNTPSSLLGSLSSNGRLVLVNQSGIAVGAGAVIDTAGFTASALRMTDADALAGRLRFGDANASMGGAAGLTVGGRITARDGDVVLVAPNIELGASALVQSPNGSTILAAGQQVEITGRGLEGITLLVQAPSDQVRNLGRLEGDAVGIFAGTLRHSGEIQATSVSVEGGRVLLKAAGDVVVDGTGSIVASSANGSRGGQVDVLGNRVAITGQAVVDVSGNQGGGGIRIGGDFQGKNPQIQNAQRSYLGPEAALKADASANGDGGRIIVWADDQTKAYGSISAQGGPQGGDGGFAEVSGRERLVFEASVTLQAPHGMVGSLLLDPRSIAVQIGGGAAITDVDQFADSPGTSLIIAPTTLNAVAGNVTLQATEDISFVDPVSLTTSGASLTAQAGGLITVLAPITTNLGGITLYANAPGSSGPGPSGSAVRVQAALNSTGGNITLRSDGVDGSGDAVVLGANVSVGSGALTLTSAGGAIRQTGGAITVAGATTVTGSPLSIALTQPGNDFSSLAATGSAISVRDANSLTVTSLNSGPNQPVSLSAGDTLVLPNTPISTGAADLTLSSGTGPLVVPQPLTGNNITLSAGGGITANANINATGNITATVSGDFVTTINQDVYANGSMALNLAGGLELPAVNQVVRLGAGTGQTINAKYVALTVTGSGTSEIYNLAGPQTITTSGQNGEGAGIVVRNAGTGADTADIYNNGGVQTITVNNANAVRVQGLSGDAEIGSLGTQTILIQGMSSLNALEIGTSGDTGYTEIWGSNQSITVGQGVQSGSIVIRAGVVDNQSAGIANDSGTQTVKATGTISIYGGSASGLSGADCIFTSGAFGGACGFIGSDGAALQTVSASTVNLFGGTSGSLNIAAIGNRNLGGAQEIEITGGGDLNLVGGNGSGTRNQAIVLSEGNLVPASGSSQLVKFLAGGHLVVSGGAVGTRHNAQLTNSSAVSLQTITGATGIIMNGGSSGGGIGLGNRAQVQSAGSQAIVVGSGGIDMAGGGGTGEETDNDAQIYQGGLAGTSQSITLTGGGSIVMQGGSSDKINVTGSSHGSRTLIEADGDSQTITLSGGNISLTGGVNGSRAFALIDALNGSQTITGAGVITLVGGASGGFNGEGNRGGIVAEAGSQTISASSLFLQGGATGIENRAFINAFANQNITVSGAITMIGGAAGGGFEDGNNATISTSTGSQFITANAISLTGGIGGEENLAQIQQNSNNLSTTGTQTITVTGVESAVNLQGGGGITNLARIRSFGTTQTLNLAGASLALAGGTGASRNFAQVIAANGDQNILGSPGITVTGGAAGGVEFLGNFAELIATTAGRVQTIVSGDMTLNAGAGGVNNSAFVGAAVQNITVQGNLNINGGGSQPSVDGTSGGGARIGAPSTLGTTNLVLDVNNDIVLTGGSVAGAAIGTGLGGGTSTVMSITAGGSVTLNPGAVSTAGARIGSAAANTVAGDISVVAGGTISLEGTVAGETAVRTLGNVALDAFVLNLNNSVEGGTVFARGSGAPTSGGVRIGGFGSITASATAGASINVVVPGGSFINAVGAGALNVAPGARWLVYGADPANDSRNGLAYDFKQYGKTFGDEVAIQGSGNGFLYAITPTAAVSLTGPVGKVYDGTDVAALTSANFLVSGGIDGDVLGGGGATTGTFDTRHVGSGKTVSVSGVTLSATDGTAQVYGYAAAGGTVSAAVGAITPAPLTVTTGDVSRSYDGTTTAAGTAVAGGGTVLFGGDTLTGGTFAFTNKNAGVGNKTVSTSGVTLSDGNSGLNYTVSYADNTTSTINRASVTLGSTNVTKTYDGTTTIAATATSGLVQVSNGNLFSGDILAGSRVFTDQNAGLGNKTVTATGVTVVDGNGGLNYNVSYVDNTTSTITPAVLSATATAPGKVYDGTTAATAALTITGGLVGAETVTATGTGSFNTKDVLTANTVTVTATSLANGTGGGAAANYSLAAGQTAPASITPKALTASYVAANKQYDGGVSASITGGLTGIVAGDALTVAQSASFADRNVGIGKAVVVSTSLTGGVDIGNYTLSTPTFATTASITQLASVAWTGSAADGLWSSAGNWAGLALPDGGNVAAVVIPAGAGTVQLNSSISNISIQSASPVVQGGGSVISGQLELVTQAGVALNNASNNISALSAVNTVTGDIAIQNTGVLNVQGLSNSAGNIVLTNAGGVTTTGLVSAAGGNVSITANSPLTIGSAGVVAGGDITLVASNLSSAGDLTLNGPVTAGNQVLLDAGNTLTQNSAVLGPNGVSAMAVVGPMVFGPFATTNGSPISYTVNGVPVAPPPTTLVPDVLPVADTLVTFLDLFEAAVEEQLQEEFLETIPDGSTKKKKNEDTIVTEGEICR